ncbi:MAG: DUF3179 domain-containing protein [Cyanobacteria bacterium P01_F01_bin.150]
MDSATLRKRLQIIGLGTMVMVPILFGVAIAQAGGWDNFKLRYYSLTQVFHNQDQEFDDLRKQQSDFTASTRIAVEQLLNGGPPKDGIPSIDAPQFDTAQTTPFKADDLVIGVVIDGDARAYPFNIMNWHEMVNDTVGGQNVAISYCPLCDTIVAFDLGETTFGVSGKLYQSCLVMYDRADDTLYSQPWNMGIMGSNVNNFLDRVPTVKTTLGEWLRQYPDSKILSTRTGHSRDYSGYPYGSYYTNEQIVFPVRNQERLRHHPKAIASYIWEPDGQTPHNQFSGSSHQFIHEELRQVGTQEVEFAGRTVVARWDEALSAVIVEELDGTVVPSSTAFAFVYPAFFPEGS